MEGRGSYGVARDVPSRAEDQKVCQGGGRIATRGCQDAEDARIDVVDGDGAHVDELGQIVLVRDVVAVPGDDVEGAVVLRRLEKLAAELVDDFPGRLFDFVFGHGVEEVAGVGEAVCAEGACSGCVRRGGDEEETGEYK